MLIADSSAWIQWFRSANSAADLALDQALEGEQVLLIEPVRAELMFGARSKSEASEMHRLFESIDIALIAPRDDFEAAVHLHLQARSLGVTPRGLIDCLIVSTAARLQLPVLHHDRDFCRLLPVAGVAEVQGSLQFS